MNILKGKEGKLIVARRPCEKSESKIYGPCPNCLGWFVIEDLWKHKNSCPSGKYAVANIRKQSVAIMMVNEVDSEVGTFFESFTKKDIFGLLASNDNLIRQLAKFLIQKDGLKHASNLSQKLRYMAKLLHELRTLTNQPNENLEYFLKPIYWPVFEKCLQSMSGFKFEMNQDTNVDKPSVCRTLGQCLRHVINIKISSDIQTMKKEEAKIAKEFSFVFEHKWPSMSLNAIKSSNSKKQTAGNKLPLISDLNILKKEITTNIDCLVRKKKINKDQFKRLILCTLSRLLLFNARRGSEPAAMTVEQYLNGKNHKYKNQEEIDKLSDERERKLASTMLLTYVRGKRRKAVPVLISQEIKSALECIIKHRRTFSIDNDYIFSYSNNNSYVNGWTALSNCVKECGKKIKEPKLITSTNIRKSLCTNVNMLDISESEMRWLGEHMGHSMDVQKRFYRQTDSTVELTKVAKLLIAADNDDIRKNANKRPDDMSFH